MSLLCVLCCVCMWQGQGPSPASDTQTYNTDGPGARKNFQFPFLRPSCVPTFLLICVCKWHVASGKEKGTILQITHTNIQHWCRGARPHFYFRCYVSTMYFVQVCKWQVASGKWQVASGKLQQEGHSPANDTQTYNIGNRGGTPKFLILFLLPNYVPALYIMFCVVP
jgi:hypothetical protein